MPSAVPAVAIRRAPCGPEAGLAEELWSLETALAFVEQARAVGQVLASACSTMPLEPASGAAGIEAKTGEIAEAIRSAIEYSLYTRSQPLTVPQLAGDLGARPAAAAAALEKLCAEDVLGRGGDGGLYRVRDTRALPRRTVDRAVEQVRMQLASGLHQAGSVFRVDVAEVLLNVGSLADLPGLLRRQGLIRREAGLWVVTRHAAKLPRPPRVSFPAPRSVPFSREEIFGTVTVLRHDQRRIPGPVRAGSDSWHLLRAMAAQVHAALPPAASGEEAVVQAALSVFASVLAPQEPAARRWQARSIATAIDAALATLPETPPPVPVHVLNPRPKGRRLSGLEREQTAAQVAYAYAEKYMGVDEIAEVIGLSTTTVYDLLREKRIQLRGRG
ncbi:helix-turn-helix domain-containing protein [Streptomyces sp. IBSNAI002]|uniref:helix-turn-helix domain-containing protein n=1 Tax=Streptomyces sp. IBSNAI002 TaxID=3457500 RepID=UPI003FD34305